MERSVDAHEVCLVYGAIWIQIDAFIMGWTQFSYLSMLYLIIYMGIKQNSFIGKGEPYFFCFFMSFYIKIMFMF